MYLIEEVSFSDVIVGGLPSADHVQKKNLDNEIGK